MTCQSQSLGPCMTAGNIMYSSDNLPPLPTDFISSPLWVHRKNGQNSPQFLQHLNRSKMDVAWSTNFDPRAQSPTFFPDQPPFRKQGEFTKTEKAWRNLQINTGVAMAIFPTSSSACIIFFIRAWDTEKEVSYSNNRIPRMASLLPKTDRSNTVM